MTIQEAYENMRIYLTRPGAIRANNGKVCVYEGEVKGAIHRCAVGCLLSPDDLAQTRTVEVFDSTAENNLSVQEITLRDFQGTIWDVSTVGFELSILTGDEVKDNEMIQFLSEAQKLHDLIMNWDEHGFDVRLLDALAVEFGLKVVTDEPVEAPGFESW